MKRNTKSKIFTTSVKGFFSGFIAAGLIIQSTLLPAYASTFVSSTTEMKYALATVSDSEIKAIHERICSLEANTQDENEDIFINKHEITLDVDDTFQLELTDINGVKINGAQWFVKYRAPYDELFTVDDYNLKDEACTVSNDGFVTAKKEGTTEIWAKYGNALYRCVVNVTATGETALRNKIIEIADQFRHLNDVDKVMAVHDYLIDHIEYSYTHIRSFAYGALIEGKAVCQGYAQSLSIILNSLNVDCHTIVANTKGSNPVLHEWVRVKLDDGWYYIDLTWDDTHWVQDKNYKYFLITTDMISKDHETGYSIAGGPEVDGSKYLYYAYKKQGIFATTKDDIDNIIRKQINSTNLPYTTVKIAVPSSVPDYEIHSAIRRIAGSSVAINEINDIRNTTGSYHHYGYEVGRINPVQSVNTELVSIRPINATKETTTTLELTFSSDIGELTPFNVKMSDGHITDIKRTGVGVYELTFNDFLSPSDTFLTVSVNKRGYNIANNEKTVPISVVKEAVPEVSFEAIGLKEGRLTNVEDGMKYNVGDGEWHDITSSAPVDVTTVYTKPISIVRKSSGAGRQDSKTQLIYPISTREPFNIKAINCSNHNSSDGKLVYLNRRMEYQKDGDNVWIPSPGKEVSGLSTGEYKVRYKANGLNLASSEVTVTVNAGPANTDVQRPYTPIFRPGVNASTGSPTGEINGSVGGSSAGEVGGSSGGGFGGGGFAGGGFAGGGFAGGDSSSGGGFAGGGFAGGDSSSGGGFAGGADTEADSKNVSKSDDAGAKETERKDNIASSIKGTDVISISKKVASFSKSDLNDIVKSGVKVLNITGNKVRLSFEAEAIKAISKQTEEDINIKVTGNNTAGLSSKAKKLIGVHPVYDIIISGKDGTKITNLGKGRVTVSIPYKLGKSEKAENLLIYYIDKKGNVKKVSKAVYSSKTKTITFATGRLTRFAVGYKKK